MPQGLPTVAQVLAGEITFFSLDTNLIQGAGYNFSRGALHQLPKQVPATMGLQLPEVVEREIVKHRMESVEKAIESLKGASEALARLTGLDLGPVDRAAAALNLADVAKKKFRDEVHDYAALCRGDVLPIAGADAAASLFADYFDGRPPFGSRKDKKSEFPDAICLWLLEKFATDNHTQGIIASADEGWGQYAETSPRLYRVKSIEELAALFVETNEQAVAIRAMVADAVSDPNSVLRRALRDSLTRHVSDADWDVSELYSGSSHRIEPEAYDAEVSDYDLKGEPRIWSLENEPTTWVVELRVSVGVRVSISIDFYVWDSIDREEMKIDSSSVVAEEEIDVEVYLTCSNVNLNTQPKDWDIDIEVASGSYGVDAFEVEPDFDPED